MPFSEKSTALKTKNLTLHALAPNDLEDALAIFYSDRVKATYMLPDFPTREDAVRLFDRLYALSRGTEHLVLGIYLENRLIGFLNDTGTDSGTIEVGYALHPDHWNRGYATEALTVAIGELFRLGFSAVRAGFFEENPASGRVMEKSGMHRIDLTEMIEYRDKSHRCIYFEIQKEYR